MSNKKYADRRPCRAAEVAAFILSMALTATLFAAACGAAWNLITLSGPHERVATDPAVVDGQMEKIEEDVYELAQKYGFDADAVMKLLDRSAVEDLDRRAAAWWTGVLREGSTANAPVFSAPGLEDALQADAAFTGKYEKYELKGAVADAAADIGQTVTKAVLQVRGVLFDFGLKMASDRIDMVGLTRLMRKLPTATGLLSLALAGLIALLMSRNPRECLKYYGGVLGAEAILAVLVFVLMKIPNPGALIREASERLYTQYVLLKNNLTTGMIGAIAALAGLCVLCLWLYNRKRGAKAPAAEDAAAEENGGNA